MFKSLIDTLTVEQRSYEQMITDNDLGAAIQEKIQYLRKMYIDFLEDIKAEKSSPYCLNQKLLVMAVMDYFTDLVRIKEFHPVSKANVYKRIGYLTYWFLRRKPIQIIHDDSEVLYDVNERFAVSYIINELLTAMKETNPAIDWNECWKKVPDKRKQNFFQNWLYYLTYRNFDAQSLEFSIMNFEMGFDLIFPDDEYK